MANLHDFLDIRSEQLLHGGGRDQFVATPLTGLNQAQAQALTRAEWRADTPIALRWVAGSTEPGHIVTTTLGAPLIVSQHVVQLLASHGFSGWKPYDVSLTDRWGRPLPGYVALSIWGRWGAASSPDCHPHPRQHGPDSPDPAPSHGMPDHKTWDGSDLFCSRNGSGHVFLTRAVATALNLAELTQRRAA